MSPTALETVFIAGGFTFLGAIIGAGTAIHLRRKNIAENNVRKFVSVFIDFMVDLERKGTLFPSGRIEEIERQHLRAEVELRTSLGRWSARKFREYWKKYKKTADKYYTAPAKLMGDANADMLKAVEKLIRQVKKL